MSRPIVFALEVVAGLAIATAGAWLAAKSGLKMNAKSNADVRASWAAERNATANERIAAAMERAYPERRLPRPSLLSRATFKTIPEPDPDPCMELARSCNARPITAYLPTLGGTAHD